ncbi:hypothetical protein Tco_0071128 [Tanacetum coccineum]
MADENVPAPAPTRSDDQILPFAAWVPIGKSNYIGAYSFQLDESRFVLDANLLREALEITPIDQAHYFVSPPLGDAIMDFVNELRYTEARLLGMIGQDIQFFRCFGESLQVLIPTKKGMKDKPHVIPYFRFTKLIIYHLGRIHNIHQRSASPFHLAEEDLRQGNLKFISKGEKDKVFGMPIPNELISNDIRNAPYYNACLEMVAKHDRKIAAEKEGKKKTASAKQPKSMPATEKTSKPAPASKPMATPLQKAGRGKVAKVRTVKSSFQLVDEPYEEPAQPEPELVPKTVYLGAGEEHDVEQAIQMSLKSFHAEGHAHVGGMAIQEPVAERNLQTGAARFRGRSISLCNLDPLFVASRSKLYIFFSIYYTSAFQKKEPVAEATRPLPVVEGKGKAIVTEEQAALSLLALHTPKRRSTTGQFIFQRRTPATEEALTGPSTQPQDDTSTNIVGDSSSPADAETCANTNKTNSGGDTEIMQFGEEQDDEMANVVNLEEKTAEIDENQVGSDPGETLESRPPPEDDKMDEDQAGLDPGESSVAFAGPNPEPTHEEFMANVYPNVHESLKFPADEHVILEDLLSSTRTLSLMKNLDDAFTIRDQLINDQATKDDLEKLNVELEVVSLVTVPIYQASSLVPPMSTPVIDLSSPKPAPSTTETPIFTATTTTTTTTTRPPLPPQQQSITDSELAVVFNLKLRDLPHKIDETVCETVKEVVQVALQDPLRDRFRDLLEADMKEMLHGRMFETGSYKLLPKHVALYEALEASIERAQRDEFLAKKDKSRKRRRDDQDPPPPLPDSDPSKKRRHDSGTLGSSQPPAPQSSAWKSTDTRDAPSSSSKQ